MSERLLQDLSAGGLRMISLDLKAISMKINSTRFGSSLQ